MTEQLDNDVIEHLAIGLGPANLSLAALAASHQDLSIQFIEKKPRFEWHEGALLAESSLQSSFLRDLVTLVDPTHRFSFLSYLHQNKRMYQFMAADFAHVPRAEFNRYYQWVARQLNNVSYGEWVNEIHFNDKYYSIHTSKRIIKAKHLILGTGTIPYYPEHSILDINENVFHGMSYKSKDKTIFNNKNVVIVGSNQSSAEIFQDLLQQEQNIPASIQWIANDILQSSGDLSPFQTELFTPAYSEFVQSLTAAQADTLFKHQSKLRDGVSTSTLKQIYQRLHQHTLSQEHRTLPSVLINNSVTSQREIGEQIELTVTNQATGEERKCNTDIVIYCTGLEHKLPEFLNPIKSLLTIGESRIKTDEHHQAITAINSDNRLYVQNGSAASFGVANQHLALGAYNGATIINHLLGYKAYELESEPTMSQWQLT